MTGNNDRSNDMGCDSRPCPACTADAPWSVYVCSPSGVIRDKAGFKRGIKQLKGLGAVVQVDPDALSRCQRFAGDDATRVGALQRAADSACDMVLLGRGGYGLTRIMDVIPWAAIARRIVDQGQIWMGYSDFTALQMGLLAHHAQAVTWAGPLVADDLGAVQPDPITLACFLDVLQRRSEGMGWRIKRKEQVALAAAAANAKHVALDRPLRGTLWGGNLCVLTKLVGTPWLPQIHGGLLFLEDVHEAPYSIERMLSQLEWAGLLQRQRAILLGQFSGYSSSPLDRGFGLSQVLERLRQRMAVHGIPVFCQLPFGHLRRKVCLPVGAQVELHYHNGEVLLHWDSVPHAALGYGDDAQGCNCGQA